MKKIPGRKIYVVFAAVFVLTGLGGLAQEDHLILFNTILQGQLRSPADLVYTNQRLFVLDAGLNEVAVFDLKGRFLERFGSIGSEPGDFFRPVEILEYQQDSLLIHDLGNDRIQILSQQGSSLASFRIEPFEGLAVGRQGEILAGQPQYGRLISSYDKQGVLERRFGSLKSYSEVYGREYRSRNRSYRRVLNSIVLESDREGNAYVAFRFAPIVAKYDPSGKLLWEVRPESEAIRELSQRFVTSAPGASGFIQTFAHGKRVNVICLDAAFDHVRDRLLVLLPGRRILELGADGSLLKENRCAFEQGAKGSKFLPTLLPAVIGDEVTAIDMFQDKIYSARISLPAVSSGAAAVGATAVADGDKVPIANSVTASKTRNQPTHQN